MKEVILNRIQRYNQQIENMQWHLRTNAAFVNDKERHQIEMRISDHQDFVAFLTQLAKFKS